MADKNTKKAFAKAILTLIIIGLSTYIAYDRCINVPVDESDNTRLSFQINKGELLKDVATNLKEKDLIRSKTFFLLYSRINDLDTQILAGRFLLERSMNVPEIITALSDPSQAEYILTIQEGLRVSDIDQKLVDLNLIKKGELITAVKSFNGWEYYDFLDKPSMEKLDIPLEGYIYPDTYFLDPTDFTPNDIIYLALDNFEQKWNALDTNNSSTLSTYSSHEVVTMASILENEVFGAQDRRTVSGILWKRLRSGWTLGADATLLYITDDRTITSQDLDLESPYNTRKNLGLPPGPISNPSIDSIEAALSPVETNYWFYLTTLDTGKVIYAENNEQHNANRDQYL